MKKIAHIDINAFFAQAEVLRNPSLKGKPIAIGNDSRRSVLSTASYEARKFHVNSAMPIAQAKILCPNLIIIPGDYHYYFQLSHSLMHYLKKRFGGIEQVSVDECYIDLTDYLTEGHEAEDLFDIQMDIFKAVKLKVSIGLGSNKFLAKMGSDYKKPLGITVFTKENLPEILWPISIEKMYGIGKRTAPKLIENGIATIGDLAKCQNPQIRKILGNLFEYFQGQANGFGDDVINTSAFDPKSISAERTFPVDALTYEEISAMIESCCHEIHKELSYYNKEANVVFIKLRTPDFKTKSKQKSLPFPIHTEKDIIASIMDLFDHFYQGEPLRLIGVGLSKVAPRKDNEEKQSEIKNLNSMLNLGGKVFLGSDLKGNKK